MRKRYYVAYGSNLNIRQMRYRCPDARVLGTAELKGWELLFKGSKSGSYLTIEQKEGCNVPVAIWAVSEEDEENLDRYEGYPMFYYKKEMELSYTGIDSKTVRKRRMFVYIMHEDRPLGIPTNMYVRTCLEGYHSFGFDPNVLEEAYRKSLEEKS